MQDTVCTITTVSEEQGTPIGFYGDVSFLPDFFPEGRVHEREQKRVDDAVQLCHNLKSDGHHSNPRPIRQEAGGETQTHHL